MESISQRTLITSVLAVCLLVAISLFIYSEYQLNTSSEKNADVSALPSPSQDPATAKKTAKKETAQAAIASQKVEPTQPDKSLPVPAHQLKKLLAEPIDKKVLDEKISAANKTIAELEKQLPQTKNTTTATNQKTHSANQELNVRIDTIRKHLENN